MIWQPVSRSNGEEIPEYAGNFYFSDARLMLSTYVDDLTLAGPKESHAPFWKALCGMVDVEIVEPPEPIHRILGRDHLGHPPCRTSSPFSRLTPTSPAQARLGYARDRFPPDFPDAPCMDYLST